MPKTAYKVYPSGFLGSTEVATTKPIDLERIRDRLFDLSVVTNPDGHTANLEVTRMWGKVTAGDPTFKTFDFKEYILRTAISAFGTDNIYDWFASQVNSPYYDKWNARWIDETLMFIYAGKARELSTHNWTTLLQMVPADGSKIDSMIVKHFFFNQTFAGDSSSHTFPESGVNTTVCDFIKDWVRCKGGIDDLAASLYVIFGER